MNIILISANSFRIINKEIKKIVNQNEYETINYNNSTLDDIIDEASYISMFDNELYLVINNADFFNKIKLTEAEENRLIKYLNNPNETKTIIFTTLNGLDKRKKITKIIKDKYQIIEIPDWDKKVKRNEANNYLKTNNYNIDYETMSYILNNTYDNTDILFNELDKIMLFYNHGCNIKLEDVKNIIGEEKNSNSWDFINSVLKKDLENSLKILKNLKIYKVEPITLIILLYREYKIIYFLKNMKVMNYTVDNIMKEFNLRDWQIDNLYQISLKYTNNELIKYITLLGDLDYKIKSGIYDKDTSIYTFLLQICI